MLKKGKECFDKLSMNGIFSIISKLPPFVLSPSKDSGGVFQQPARAPVAISNFSVPIASHLLATSKRLGTLK